MSYYRRPDDLPDGEGAPDAADTVGAVPGAGWPEPPVPGRAPGAGSPPIPVEELADAVAATEAKRRRQMLILAGCVAIDVVIIAVLLALFAF